jgi:hypothetical protein
MSFKALLNKTCDIELITLCASSGGEQKETYTKIFSSLPCRLRTRSVWERRYGDPAYQKSDHILYLNFVLINADVRVLLDGVPYRVTGQADMGGAKRYLCLYLERIN